MPYHEVLGTSQADLMWDVPQSSYLGSMVHYHARPIDKMTYEALHTHRIIWIARTRTGEPMNEYRDREAYWT